MRTSAIFVTGLFASAMASPAPAPNPQLSLPILGNLLPNLPVNSLLPGGATPGGLPVPLDLNLAGGFLGRLQELSSLVQTPLQQAQQTLSNPTDPAAALRTLTSLLQQVLSTLGGANGWAPNLNGLAATVTGGAGLGGGNLAGTLTGAGGVGGLAGLGDLTKALSLQQQQLGTVNNLASQLLTAAPLQSTVKDLLEKKTSGSDLPLLGLLDKIYGLTNGIVPKRS